MISKLYVQLGSHPRRGTGNASWTSLLSAKLVESQNLLDVLLNPLLQLEDESNWEEHENELEILQAIIPKLATDLMLTMFDAGVHAERARSELAPYRGGKSRGRFSDAKKIQIRKQVEEMKTEGVSTKTACRAIGEKFGCSYKTIERILKKS